MQLRLVFDFDAAPSFELQLVIQVDYSAHVLIDPFIHSTFLQMILLLVVPDNISCLVCLRSDHLGLFRLLDYYCLHLDLLMTSLDHHILPFTHECRVHVL